MRAVHRVARIALAAVALGIVPAVFPGGEAAAQEIVIGLSTARTGRYATSAATNEAAVDIAVAEINARGGVNGHKLRVEVFDTNGDPKNAQIAVQRFAEDVKAMAVIGPFSSQEAQVAFAAGERLGIVQMSNSATAPGITRDRAWGWSMVEDEGKQFARLLKTLSARNIVKEKTAVVMYPSDEFVGKALSAWMPKLLEANGWKQVIPPEGFPTNAADLSPHVTKLQGRSPAVIAFAGLPEGAVKVMKEMRRQGHASVLIGSQIFADPDIGRMLGPDGEGAVFVTWYWWDSNDRTRAFERKFLEEIRKRGLAKGGAHHVDASAYDIVYVFADGMRRAGVTGSDSICRSRTSTIGTGPA